MLVKGVPTRKYQTTLWCHYDVIKWEENRVTGPLCGGPVTGEFPSQMPVTRSFDVFFDLRPNNRLSKQSRRRRLETQSRWLWRQCNDVDCFSWSSWASPFQKYQTALLCSVDGINCWFNTGFYNGLASNIRQAINCTKYTCFNLIWNAIEISLTPYGLVTPHSDKGMAQHWLR